MRNIPVLFRVLGYASVATFGTMVIISTVAETVRAIGEAKKKKIAPRCSICKGKGFYRCELCKGEGNIKWSPLHDPIFINPCVCPTCDGNRIQSCLNCLSRGYA